MGFSDNTGGEAQAILTDHLARQKPDNKGGQADPLSSHMLSPLRVHVVVTFSLGANSPPDAIPVSLCRSIGLPQANNDTRIRGGRGSADHGLLPRMAIF